jgi:hypothetical protein
VLTILTSSATALTQGDLGGRRIGAFVGEPYFGSSLLPWHVRVAATEVARRVVVELSRLDYCSGASESAVSILFNLSPPQNLYFWYARTNVDHLLAEDAVIMPSSGRLMAVAVELKGLYKRYALALQKVELFFSQGLAAEKFSLYHRLAPSPVQHPKSNVIRLLKACQCCHASARVAVCLSRLWTHAATRQLGMFAGLT